MYTLSMPEMKLGTSQQMQQQMKLSPQMIQTVTLMALPTTELRERIYEEVEKNPALEILSDKSEVTSPSIRTKEHLGNASSSGKQESDNFQSFLENRPQHEETLQEHLLFQLGMLVLPESERFLTEKVIKNLDEKGFHHVSPESLIDAALPEETPELLEKCIQNVRKMDPTGVACYGVQESLIVQAELKGKEVPPLALFILKHHFALLETPRSPVIYKKLSVLPPAMTQGLIINQENIEEALSFIKTLDPQPARQFSASSTVYVAPDVIIKKIPVDDEESQNGDKYQLQIEMMDNQIPEIIVSPVFERLAEKKEDETKQDALHEAERKFVTDSVRDARWFLNAVELRSSTLKKVIQVLLRRQRVFFEGGPRYLSPLRMKDVAEEINVHEATISRIANGKYLRCDWGFFEIKYFFSNASGQSPEKQMVSSSNSKENVKQEITGGGSKESVKQELKILIDEYEKTNPTKKLSDEKLSTLLAEKGINIARRTVAKYRKEMNITSSFER